jgi:hypothetical protein
MDKIKCKHIKANKKKCNSYSMNDSDFCYLHNPEIKESEKQKHRKNGGLHSAIKINCDSDFEYYELNSIENIIQLNAVLINKVLNAKLDLRILTGIGYSLNLQMKLIDLHTIEKKLENIENIIIKLPTSFNYEL